MTAYYNEWDQQIAAWLRELIRQGHVAPGEVDERSIKDVTADDLKGFRQVHFFAGIGGWSYALRLAGWPDDAHVWTGSCPCQPFINAGARKGMADDRHLWPEMLRLVAECRPEIVFGEQVASAEVVGTELEAAFVVAVQAGDYAKANGLANRLVKSGSFGFDVRWLDGVCADLEREGYAVGAHVFGAHSVGAPNIRQRLWWVAESNGARFGSAPVAEFSDTESDAESCGRVGGLGDASGKRSQERDCIAAVQREAGPARQRQAAELPSDDGNVWDAYDLVYCRDAKYRRIKPGSFPLAHGVPARVVRLRGYGNAINPWVAKEWIKAYREAKGGLT